MLHSVCNIASGTIAAAQMGRCRLHTRHIVTHIEEQTEREAEAGARATYSRFVCVVNLIYEHIRMLNVWWWLWSERGRFVAEKDKLFSNRIHSIELCVVCVCVVSVLSV